MSFPIPFAFSPPESVERLPEINAAIDEVEEAKTQWLNRAKELSRDERDSFTRHVQKMAEKILSHLFSMSHSGHSPQDLQREARNSLMHLNDSAEQFLTNCESYKIRKIDINKAYDSFDAKIHQSTPNFATFTQAATAAGATLGAGCGYSASNAIGDALLVKAAERALKKAGETSKAHAHLVIQHMEAQLNLGATQRKAAKSVAGKKVVDLASIKKVIQPVAKEAEKIAAQTAAAYEANQVAQKTAYVAMGKAMVGSTKGLKGAVLGGIVGGIPGAMIGVALDLTLNSDPVH